MSRRADKASASTGCRRRHSTRHGARAVAAAAGRAFASRRQPRVDACRATVSSRVAAASLRSRRTQFDSRSLPSRQQPRAPSAAHHFAGRAAQPPAAVRGSSASPLSRRSAYRRADDGSPRVRDRGAHAGCLLPLERAHHGHHASLPAALGADVRGRASAGAAASACASSLSATTACCGG